MFILQKQLSVLNVPAARVATILRSGTDIQLAMPEMPSQMASAFLLMLKGGGKVKVLIGLFMAKSRRSIFYVSDSGEVPAERAEAELEAGIEFAESMGFVLTDIEFERKNAEQQETYLKSLPICQRQNPEAAKPSAPAAPESKAVVSEPVALKAGAARTEPVEPVESRAKLDSSTVSCPAAPKPDLQERRRILKERLGRFLASL